MKAAVLQDREDSDLMCRCISVGEATRTMYPRMRFSGPPIIDDASSPAAEAAERDRLSDRSRRSRY